MRRLKKANKRKTKKTNKMIENSIKTKYIRLVLCVICTLAVAFAYTAEGAFAASTFKTAKVTGVKAKQVANKTVKVSWKKKRGADGYVVYYSLKKNGKYKKCAFAKATDTFAKVRKLSVGKTYYFKVRPFKKNGKGKTFGKYSKRVKATIGPNTTRISARTVFETTSKIKITFKKSKKAAGYEIWRANSKNGKFKKIKTLKAGKNTFINTKLTAHKTYYYKMRPYMKVKGKKVYGVFSNVSADCTDGNSEAYALSNTPYKPYTGNTGMSLDGKKILFLGSSVTYGSGSGGVSFVDYLKKKDGVNVVAKEAVGGTTLSFVEKRNYCERIEQCRPSAQPQLLVCQLSSNDARSAFVRRDLVETKNPDSENEADTNKTGYSDDDILKDLRDQAATGDNDKYYVEDAIKYIIAYSNIELGCPVVFYVLPQFNDSNSSRTEFYMDMRNCLLDVERSWAHDNAYGVDFRIQVLDLWSNPYGLFPNFTINNEIRAFYMMDSVHPTKAGYLKKYVPAFERFLTNEVQW